MIKYDRPAFGPARPMENDIDRIQAAMVPLLGPALSALYKKIFRNSITFQFVFKAAAQ
jgi:hypothetical protein